MKERVVGGEIRGKSGRMLSSECHLTCFNEIPFCYIESRLKKVKDRKRKNSSEATALIQASDDGGSD